MTFGTKEKNVFISWLNMINKNHIKNYEASMDILQELIDKMDIKLLNTQFLFSVFDELTSGSSSWNIPSESFKSFLNLLPDFKRKRLVSDRLIKRLLPEKDWAEYKVASEEETIKKIARIKINLLKK